MKVLIIGEKANRSIHVGVALTEVQETIKILVELGYTIKLKEIIINGRFIGKRSRCLTILRKKIQKS